MIAKPRPKLLERREARAKVAAQDKAESAKVKARSGGYCEVRVFNQHDRVTYVCCRHASHVHHLIGGIGRRNVGKSITAECKLHVCERCHHEIHGHVLKPINDYERESAATVRYERLV